MLMYATRAEARRAIFTWTTWYNAERIHTTLDGSAPPESEQQYLQGS